MSDPCFIRVTVAPVWRRYCGRERRRGQVCGTGGGSGSAEGWLLCDQLGRRIRLSDSGSEGARSGGGLR